MVKNRYAIFLDDMRNPTDVNWMVLPQNNYITIRNYSQFIDCITKHGIPVFVSFDHDLGDEHGRDMFNTITKNHGTTTVPFLSYDKYKEKSGYACAKWLVDYCIEHKLEFPEYSVHSMNPIGKDNIEKYIESYKRSYERQ